MESNEIFGWVTLTITATAPFYLAYAHIKLGKQKSNIKRLEQKLAQYQEMIEDLQSKCNTYYSKAASLTKYQPIADAEAEVARIRHEAEILMNKAEAEYEREMADIRVFSQDKTREVKQIADNKLRAAYKIANKIENKANENAKRIAGDAWEAKKNAGLYTEIVQAMENAIKGYGNEYLIPHKIVLDEIIAEYDSTEIDERLEQIQTQIRLIIKNKEAAACDFPDPKRRAAAIALVLDAFNSKVDAIMAKVEHDNFGILSQQLINAYRIVNHNGKPFNHARITQPYYDLIKQRLKIAIAVSELKRQPLEKQPHIQEARPEHEPV